MVIWRFSHNYTEVSIAGCFMENLVAMCQETSGSGTSLVGKSRDLGKTQLDKSTGCFLITEIIKILVKKSHEHLIKKNTNH